MSDLQKGLMACGSLFLVLALAWFFVLQPMVEEENIIRRLRNTAVMQGRDPNDAEKSFREIKKVLEEAGMR